MHHPVMDVDSLLVGRTRPRAEQNWNVPAALDGRRTRWESPSVGRSSGSWHTGQRASPSELCADCSFPPTSGAPSTSRPAVQTGARCAHGKEEHETWKEKSGGHPLLARRPQFLRWSSSRSNVWVPFDSLLFTRLLPRWLIATGLEQGRASGLCPVEHEAMLCLSRAESKGKVSLACPPHSLSSSPRISGNGIP